MTDRLEGLRAAVELSPDNAGLRLVLAEALEEEGLVPEALDHLGRLMDDGGLPAERLVATGHLALAHGRLQLAARCVDSARRAGVAEGVAPLQQALEAELSDEGVRRLAHDPVEEAAAASTRVVSPEEHATFADVGGLEGVKEAIHRTIVLPFQRPDLYERYGRRAGGGVMLYGPPGCGKTLLARATAGECGLPFLNVRVEDILDPWIGGSERNLHDAFTDARDRAPCVLFLDELDALAYARRKQGGSAGRSLVDQMLQELDAIGSDNRNVLVLAATNAPWDIDDALKRPGRFDRVVFVPPPDQPARERILAMQLADKPLEADLDVASLAARAELFSGADLRHWVERAIDVAIDQALRTGGDVPVTREHFAQTADQVRPTTLDWLGTARNYVEFANESGRFDDVLEFLGGNEAKRWRSRIPKRRRHPDGPE
jgi:SpoVK/Ycf46/Vps4 family AAA+-type ATPase